ncbi:hypothetical protein MARI151_20745 [Maribacter litoralis]|uniref:Uncharacterized protein n=1 Tax=Maribacter litoralis TaxID=2059726 RepID=A0A653R798_9FLAO|nr:hypothetical protein MARI151_20745 [Maribacter litoralis]
MYIDGYVVFKINPEKAETLINYKKVLLQLSAKVRLVLNFFKRATLMCSHPILPIISRTL